MQAYYCNIVDSSRAGFLLLREKGQRRRRQRGPALVVASQGGDERVQKLLVEMVRIETEKVRVSEFVEERSKMLSDIADEAQTEYDRIAEDAMKGIDEATAKIMKNLDEDTEELERELASARAEMEASEQEFDEFEKKVQTARSEGLFFKALYMPLKRWKDRNPEEQKAIKERASNIAKQTKKFMGSKTRRGFYVVLILLLSLTILEAILSSEVQWTRVAIYGVISVFLVLQLMYEATLSSDEDESKKR